MSRKNGSKPQKAVPPCPYCARPEIFEPRRETPRGAAKVMGALVHLNGKYWQRFEERFPSIRTFTEVEYEDGERRFKIKGRQNFTPPYQGFDVEVVGLQFPFRPIISAGPGFHQSIPKDFEARGQLMRSYGACRVTHRTTGVIADAHFWESHGLLVTLKQMPRNPTGEAMNAARRLLELFTLDYRGAPKITRDGIMDALEELDPKARTLSAVARKLGVTRQALQMWGRREGMKEWAAMLEAFAPHPPM